MVRAPRARLAGVRRRPTRPSRPAPAPGIARHATESCRGTIAERTEIDGGAGLPASGSARPPARPRSVGAPPPAARGAGRARSRHGRAAGARRSTAYRGPGRPGRVTGGPPERDAATPIGIAISGLFPTACCLFAVASFRGLLSAFGHSTNRECIRSGIG